MIDRLTTMDAIVSRTVAPWRFSVWMFGVFATLACVMASVGLFSLVSLEVTSRRHEFAVRMALGAGQSELVRSVMVVAGRRVLVGITFGLCAALIAVRGMRSILFGVGTLDAPTYGAVVALVALVVAVASYLPARRASRIDPLDLLRRGQQ